MKSSRVLIIVIFVAVAAFSCREKDGGPAAPGTNIDEIIPLAIGNQWVTHTAFWDSAGRPYVTLVDTNRIVRDSTMLFERWFLGKRGVWMTNRSTGYWVLSDSVPELYLKYPTFLNDHYMYGSDSVRVIAVDTSVTVSGGTFVCTCYKMAISDPAFANQILLASANTGIIRREVVGRTPGGHEYLASREDLISFQLR